MAISTADRAAAPAGATGAAARAPVHLVLVAWLALALYDLLLLVGGMPRIVALLRRLAARPLRTPADVLPRTRMICASVSRARTFYPHRALCLQTAAVTAALLRAGGLPNDFVIGVRRVPFMAHAWVEVGGQIVMNEERGQMHLYRVIVRC